MLKDKYWIRTEVCPDGDVWGVEDDPEDKEAFELFIKADADGAVIRELAEALEAAHNEVATLSDCYCGEYGETLTKHAERIKQAKAAPIDAADV